MKKLLLLSLTFILSFQSKSQVVFCPPGAEWNYLYSGTIFWPGITYNEQVKYSGDSIEGLDTLKILSHNRFFMTCGPRTNATLIKQKGDTVFFKNKFSDHNWQILYNYATPIGQSWQTTLTTLSQTKTVTYTVQAIGTTTVNGLSLKQMTVSSSDWGGTVITERFGSNAFLFNFTSRNIGSCDSDIFIEFLCYQDDSFGLKQFTEKACDYRTYNSVGMNELAGDEFGIFMYPNPVMNELTVESNFTESAQLILSDVSGKELKSVEFEKTIRMDVSNFKSGIYFVSVKQNGRVIQNTKFIKE